MYTITFDYYNQYDHDCGTHVLSHSHTCYELTYYVYGKGTTTFGSGESAKQESYVKGSYAIYEPGGMHDEHHSEDTRVRCVGFMVHNNSVIVHPGIFTDTDGEIAGYIERLWQEVTGRQQHYDVMLDLIMNELIVAYVRQQFPTQEKFNEMYYVTSMIDSNFTQKIETETLVELSGYSYHRFRHIFKEKTGYSPMNYIIHLRIDYSKRLLTQTDNSISEIAVSCGFCSGSQFAEMFKREEKISPSQFRKRHLQQMKAVDDDGVREAHDEAL